MRAKMVFPALMMAFGLFGWAQNPPDTPKTSTIEEKLRPVFQEWDRPDRLGGVVAVVEKGAVVYKKCFGQANAEYQILNTPQTVFDVSSLAEPVTGMAIAMLEEQSKLAAAESIRKYFPELPAYADSITLSHLLYHTSGLPDWFELLTLAGWNEEDVITLDHVLKLLGRQKKLLFEPGSKHSPSRTNYTLLAEVVKRATGQSFRDWTWQNIFKPLGMPRTHFHDNHREVVENRAYSINYHRRDGYLKGADNLAVVGSTSLFTTLDDFLKWIWNFESPQVGSTAVRDKMMTSGKLANGDDAGHSYGFRLDTLGGLRRIQKSGQWGGFRAAFHYYPEASFGVVIFGNWDYGWTNPLGSVEEAARACLEALIKEKQAKEPPQTKDKRKPVKLSSAVLAQYEGDYRLQPGYYLKIAREGDHLVLQELTDQKIPLVPISETEFLVKEIEYLISFQKEETGWVSNFLTLDGALEMKAPKAELQNLTQEQLPPYEGTYSNEDLDARYDIILRDRKLVLTNLRRKDVTLTPENRRFFTGDSRLFSLISFALDENGVIAGFQIESDNLRHLLFKKLQK